jgi:hypothetical protein
MTITTRTTTKATHRTVIRYEPEFGERTDKVSKARKFVNEALDIVLQAGNPGRLIVDLGIGCGVGSIVFEETQTVPQRDIQQD